jgi:hypothetical protein
MRNRTIAVAVLVLLVALVAAWFAFRDRPPTPPDVAPTQPAPSAAPTPETPRPRRATAQPTEDTPAPADDAARAAQAAAERAKWPVRVTTNVPGAQVTLHVRRHGADDDPPSETKTADANGFAGFDTPKDVEIARLDFVVRAEGWTTVRKHEDEPGDVRIELARAVALRGRIVDEKQRAVADATLLSIAPSQWLIDRSRLQNVVDANPDGTFETFVAEPGAVVFRVESPSHLPKDVTVTAPASDVVVVLERGLEVSGRVEFAGGAPLAGATISDGASRTRATTDADGRFVVSGLARGPVELECDATRESQIVDAGTTGVVFVVRNSVARLRYVDTKGRRYRFLETSVRAMKGDQTLDMAVGTTDNAGGDELVSGRAGVAVVVSAEGARGETGSAQVTFDDVPRLHELDVVLGAPKPRGTLRLLVRRESGDVLRAAYVAVEDDAGTTVAGDARKRLDLDAAGATEMAGVPAGRVKVTVADSAHWSAESLDTFLVAAHATADVETGRTVELTATLAVGGRVRASVRDETGNAIVPRGVRLLAADGRVVDMFIRRKEQGGWTSELDASPSVLLDAVPPGRYVVQATTADGTKATKDVDVVRGETVDVVVTVPSKR